MQKKTWLFKLHEEDLIRLEKRLYRIFWSNKDSLANIGYDYNDVRSECMIKVYEMQVKYGKMEYKQFIKLINKSIGYIIMELLRKSNMETKRVKKVDFYSDILYNYSNENPYLDMLTDDFYTILNKCPEKVRQIVEMKIINGQSLDEISTILKMSKRGIHYIYKAFISDLRIKLGVT